MVDRRKELVMKLCVRSMNDYYRVMVVGVGAYEVVEPVRHRDFILSKDILFQNFVYQFQYNPKVPMQDNIPFADIAQCLINRQIKINNKTMGQCYSKPQQQSLRTSLKSPYPQKCLLLENPPSLILELNNGSIETIPILRQFNGNLVYGIGHGLYMGALNQLYIVVVGREMGEQGLLGAMHAYYRMLAKDTANGNLIQPQCAYLIKNQDQNCIYFVVRSRPLGPQGKFVDLVQLGTRMRQKQITWQDLQFRELVIQASRKYGQLGRDVDIRNVLIGTDGSVHFLSLMATQGLPIAKSVQKLQSMLMSSLYGVTLQEKQKEAQRNWPQLQQRSKFKHPNSLSLLQNLPQTIRQESRQKPTPITNPCLKFIRDYITAYYYKLQVYSYQLIDAMIGLGQYAKAKELLALHVEDRGLGGTEVDEEIFGVFGRVLQVEAKIDRKSAQTMTARARVCSAAQYLGLKFKNNNNYSKSHWYYTQALTHKSSSIQLPQSLHMELAETCKALSKHMETQSTLVQGLLEHPNSKALNLSLIVHLCDCMRVDEAENRLMKATPCFGTLEMQIASAKILLAKAVMDPKRGKEYLGKAKVELEKVALGQYRKNIRPNTSITSSQQAQPQQPQQQPQLCLPLYYQTLADHNLQTHNFPSAQQHYHTSKLLLKNSKASTYRLATITAAQANCLLMQEMYTQAIAMYTEAEGYLGAECKSVRDGIRGNCGIARLRAGMWDDGVSQIQAVLSDTDKQVIATDYNYTFLANILEKAKEKTKP